MDRVAGKLGRPAVVDAAVAIVLGGLGAADALTTQDYPEPHAASAVLALAAGLALASRRSHPLWSFTATVGALTALSLAVGHFEAGSSLLVILVSAYSVGAHNQNLRVSLAAGLIFAAASGFGPGQPAAQMWPDFAFSVVLVLLPLSVGVSMRRQVRRAVLAERRTVTLEFTQQQRAHEAVQQERRRIARELHDIVSHGLGLVVLHAGVADRVLDTDPARARESLQLIRETGQEAIREMGTLVNLAREDTAASRDPQPNLTDVERLVATTRAAGLNVRLVRLGEQRPLTAAVELNAYRVIQEGLTNALKHAGAATVTVALRYQPDGIDVEVTDDGASGTAGGGGRHGLLGLRERVAVFGGTFDAGGAPEGGWTLRATFPTTR